MSVYTESMVAELKALAEKGPITFAMAEAFAAANGVKVRSVVGKVKSMKLAYAPKPTKVTKTGEPVVLKTAIVAAIETALAVKAPSLEKATKEDLARLLEAVGALAVAE